MKLSELRPEIREARKEDIFKKSCDALAERYSHWNEADLTKAMAERAIGKLSVRDIRETIANKMRTRNLILLGEIQTEKPNQKHRKEWMNIQYAEKWEKRFTTPEVLSAERAMLRAIHRIVNEERPQCRQ